MIPNSGDNPLHTEDETSILLGKNSMIKSDNEDEEPIPKNMDFKNKYLNRFFLIEAFAWFNYLLGILNILFNAVVYLQLYEPDFYQKFQSQCHDQMPMVIFLDNFLTISTILFFAYILRYLKQVD